MKSNKHIRTWLNPTRKELTEARVRATIAFDLDSTLNEMGAPGGLHKYVADALGCTVEESTGKNVEGCECFHFQKEGVNDEEIQELVLKYILEESPSLTPTPYMADVLDYVYFAMNERITVVTYRDFATVDVTHDWLNANLPKSVGPFNLIMLQGMPKSFVLKLTGTNVFVDDRYKTAQSLENEINLSVLYERPWNQGRKVQAGDMSIKDLRGLLPLVNILARRSVMTWPTTIPYPEREGTERIE